MGIIITLLTDFGTVDGYVGAMKGVILSLAPEAQIVDLTHAIPAQDIRAGAWALDESARFYPAGSIHLAVVDPGVGSHRKALVIQCNEQFFIGPDNGVLSFAAAYPRRVRVLDQDEFFRHPVSSTFHGRDIFAAVAGHLASGVSPDRLGSATVEWTQLERPAAHKRANRITGHVLHIDHFGNLITNISGELLGSEEGWVVELPGLVIGRIHSTFSEVPVGQWVAYIGSGGMLELAIREEQAAKQGYQIHTEVILCKR